MGRVMAELLPKGTQIAGFVLDDPLGRGGFGVTYRAHSLKGGNVFAIKEYFPADLARRTASLHVVAVEDPKLARLFEFGRKAFLDEAYILRDLPRQPGLVRVRSAFEKYNTAYCVTEFIDGDTLDRVAARIVDARGHVPESHVLNLVATLCRALAAVHRAGFIHRDIKPGNVMINRAGDPILIDFGAARAHGDSQTVTSMLSRRYAALEQFPTARRIGSRALREGAWTDIHALSVMLYELISQSLPPSAEERLAEVQANRPDPYLPLRMAMARNRINGSYSDSLLAVIDRGCSLMPEDRPSDTDDFLRPIEPIMRPVMPVAAMPPPRPATRSPQTEPRRPAPGRSGDRHKAVIMLGLILGLALLSAVFGLRG